MAKSTSISVGTLIIALLVAGSMLYGQHEVSAKEKPQLDVPYEPTSYGIASEMLNMAGVTSSDLLYDLGCGDGRIVVMAASERGTRGIGVDMDSERIRESLRSAERAGVVHLVQFHEQNLFETRISDATVVMLYLWPEVNLRLRPKLLRELQPGTRIVSHSHTMGQWEDDATRDVEGHTLHFFVVPANVSGTWEWVGPGKRPCSLQLSQKFQKVKGSITIGKETFPIANSSLRGNDLLFSVETKAQGKEDVLSFSGRVLGDTIDGMMTGGSKAVRPIHWKASRKPFSAISIAE